MKFLMMIILFVNSAFACPVEEHEFMLSGMKAFSESESVSGLTKEDFEEVLTRVKNHYEPEFKSQRLGMEFTMDWSNTWFNAQTGWAGPKTVKFFFSGEAARGKYMTKDGLMFIGCHEMGHHFGGFPKKDGKWSTSEGGADYFAALKCMRALLKGDRDNGDAEKLALHVGVQRKCQEVYSDTEDYQICLRTAKAGHDMFRAFEYNRTKVEKTDWMFFQNLLAVTETITKDYPSRACRAETAYQGAICNKGPEFPLSFTSETEGVCHELRGDTFGMRPKCWFRPTL